MRNITTSLEFWFVCLTMYAGEDGEVCVELGYLGKGISTSKVAQPDKSKAGGLPAWFGDPPVPLDDLVCGLCRRNLLLVAQVYAPTHVQRSLCVFGCNRAACSLLPQGWRVIRTQTPQPAPSCAKPATSTASSSTTAIIDVAPPAPPVPTRPLESAADAWGANATSWGDADEGSDSWGAETTSEWNTAGGDDGTAAGDGGTTGSIDALLDEQERRSTRMEKGPAESLQISGGGKISSAVATSSRTEGKEAAAENPAERLVSRTQVGTRDRRFFPAKLMNFAPEPWAESSGVDDKDMENRLRRYREQEEDRGLVAALDQAIGLKDSAVGGKQGAGAVSAGVGEKYERTPARAKAVMRFADRVSRSPHQVVRYAYGGQALWSASDPPEHVVPQCTCGATRVFEMQLMPALLLQLQANDFAEQEPNSDPDENIVRPDGIKQAVAQAAEGQKPVDVVISALDKSKGGRRPPADSHGRSIAKEQCYPASGDDDDGKSATTMPTPSAEKQERLRTLGMDWGLVAVWCCPRSCEASCEEVVVVQLPV